MTFDIIQALDYYTRENPAIYGVTSDGYETLEWQGPGPKPTEAQLRQAYNDSINWANDRTQGWKRAEAYKNEADPLFFKAQRGEATMQQWTDKVNEIKARYPKSTD